MAQRSNHPPAKDGEESFEVLLSRLEEIVGQLEAGERPLEESLTLYEQGVATLKRCHVILDGADKRIRRLLQNSAGEPVLQDVTRSATAGGKRGKAQPAETPSTKEISAQDSGQDFRAAPDEPETEPEEEIENSGKLDVDAEPSTQQNPPSSIAKSKIKSTQGGKAGGSLFGSAQ